MIPDEWLPQVVRVTDATVLILVFTIFIIFYYFCRNSNESLLSTITHWPTEAKERLILACKYYLSSLLLLSLCALCGSNSPSFQQLIKDHYYIATIGTSIGLFLSLIFINSFSYTEKYRAKLFFFLMHTVLLATTLLTLGREICIKAGFYTLQLIAVLIIIALTAQMNFHEKLVEPLSKINAIVTAASICVTIIGTPKNSLEIFLLCLNIHLGFILFAWMFVLNTQMFIKDCSTERETFDPVYLAAVMEISTLNLFLRIATLATLKATLKNLLILCEK
ncbi:growth hormone-inducible transmembrane protein-like [Lycorma delicatula]|uniref:growth hormone-inducible transmembrane protein-like n=1 Tax=Lycorma delicatula TaxID=130591 RepID=UPI003F515048